MSSHAVDPILLTPTSPQRRAILEQLGIPFDVLAPEYVEHDPPEADAEGSLTPPSAAVTTLLPMQQQGLFDQPAEIDFTREPYAEKRESGRRLAQEFVINEAQGFDLMLAYGSEAAARRALIQRWYRDEVKLRDEAA